MGTSSSSPLTYSDAYETSVLGVSKHHKDLDNDIWSQEEIAA